MTREEAKLMFKDDVNSQGCYKSVLTKIDLIYDEFENLPLVTERDICKRAKIIKTELEEDNQDFCQASYLMGALDYKNGDI